MGQQGLFLTQDWLAVGMVSAAQFEEMLEGHFIGLVLALGQLLKHHLALHGEGIALEFGLKHELEQELQRFWCRSRWNQDVVVNVIKARGCVALATQGFDALIKLTGGEAAAPFKHHVLKEVGQATFPGGLIDAASATPKIDADQGSGLHSQDHHLGSIG
jgi:hypothetical protein